MFAISFDMTVSELEACYGKPYNRAYYEIKESLKKNDFNWIQGSTYLTVNGNLGNLYKAINDLSKFEWFRKSVRDIRAYKVEDWSDFTQIVKNAKEFPDVSSEQRLVIRLVFQEGKWRMPFARFAPCLP